jgi:hypothetical protein
MKLVIMQFSPTSYCFISIQPIEVNTNFKNVKTIIIFAGYDLERSPFISTAMSNVFRAYMYMPRSKNEVGRC